MKPNPIAEPQWRVYRVMASKALEGILSHIRTPGLRSELSRHVEVLFARADHPTMYIPEAVEDARQDLLALSGIGGDK